ncbi:MAG: ABC transporter substrate-binding protein [Hyphomicrobiales bacterium]
MTITRRHALSHAAGICLTLAGVSGVNAADDLKLGAVNPSSGGLALYGDEVTRGYELAADWVNGKGGVLGRKVVIVRGNASTPQEGISAVEQFVSGDKVDALIGTYISAVASAASEAALNYNKLYWDTNALAQELTERGLPNYIRSGPSANVFAADSSEVILKLVASTLGKGPKDLKVWIEHEDSIYGTSIAKEQERILKAAGVQVVGNGAHSFKSIDLTDSILRAKNAAPDVWINTGYIPDTNLLLRTARDQGFKPGAMIAVGTGDTYETLDALGKDSLQGMLVVSYPRYDMNPKYGPGIEDYLKAYRARFGKDPIAPQSMAAFVGAKILFKAIQAAGSTEVDKVRAAAAKLDDPLMSYETGFGVKFDEKMQNTRAHPVAAQWQDGKMVTVFPLAAAPAGGKLVSLARK